MRRIVSRASPSFARIRAAQFRGKLLRAPVGSFALTGTDAIMRLFSGKVIGAGPGSFGIAGQAATLKRTRLFAAAPGSFSLTGQAVSFLKGKYVQAAPGAFAMEGAAASLLRKRKVVAGNGAYALTGQAATLTVAAAFPTVVNSNTSSGTGGSTISVNLPADIVEGNKIVLLVGCAGNESLTTPSSPWSLVKLAATAGSNGPDRRLYAFVAPSDTLVGVTTLAITVGGTSGSWGAIAYQIHGAGTTLSVDAAGSGANPDPAELNPGSSEPTLWIAAANKRESADALGAPSGYSSLQVARNGNMSVMAADKASTASSENPGAFSGFSVTDNWAALTLGFRV